MPLNGRCFEHQKALCDELKIMIAIGAHVNVLALVGAVTERMKDGELYVVMELCTLGSLLGFLRLHREDFVSELTGDDERAFVRDENGYLVQKQLNSLVYQAETDSSWEAQMACNRNNRFSFTTSDLLSFALQVTNGMDYLGKKHLIHRDLAARNLLLTRTEQQQDVLLVKIADYGLARQQFYQGYEMQTDTALPMERLAPECFTDRLFTAQSDVWAFGVVLWELFALGREPYGFLPLQHIYDFLKAGNRLLRPANAPPEMHDLMMMCWLENAADRPAFIDCRRIMSANLKRCSGQVFNSLMTVLQLPSTTASQLEERSSTDNYRRHFAHPLDNNDVETEAADCCRLLKKKKDGNENDDENNSPVSAAIPLTLLHNGSYLDGSLRRSLSNDYEAGNFILLFDDDDVNRARKANSAHL